MGMQWDVGFRATHHVGAWAMKAEDDMEAAVIEGFVGVEAYTC